MAATFSELYVEGDAATIRGFLAGYTIGAGLTAPVFLNVDHDIRDDGITRQIAEWAHLVETVSHVVTAAETREPLVAAIERAGPDLGIKVLGHKPVREAHLKFKWEVYSRDEAAKLRALLEDERPPAVRLEGYAPEEEIDEDARGGAVYTPTHAYTARAKGRASGPPDALVPWADRLRRNDFVDSELIELTYGG